jgi:hypothetical protein
MRLSEANEGKHKIGGGAMISLRARDGAVRLTSAPPLEPPFDDEVGPETWLVTPEAGAQLAIDWAGAGALPGAHRGVRKSPLAGAPKKAITTSVVAARQGSASGPPAAPILSGVATVPPDAMAGASPEAWEAARRFLSRCIEVINGYRPAGHLRPMCDTLEAQSITEQLAGVARRTARRAHPRPAASDPGRPPQAGLGPGAAHPADVVRLRLRVCEPRAGVAEAAAVLGQHHRVWAAAFRLERRGPTWRCTVFIDLPPGQSP